MGYVNSRQGPADANATARALTWNVLQGLGNCSKADWKGSRCTL